MFGELIDVAVGYKKEISSVQLVLDELKESITSQFEALHGEVRESYWKIVALEDKVQALEKQVEDLSYRTCSCEIKY
jgi:hypothetical protein